MAKYQCELCGKLRPEKLMFEYYIGKHNDSTRIMHRCKKCGGSEEADASDDNN